MPDNPQPDQEPYRNPGKDKNHPGDRADAPAKPTAPREEQQDQS
jgi:hypothetical protein